MSSVSCSVIYGYRLLAEHAKHFNLPSDDQKEKKAKDDDDDMRDWLGEMCESIVLPKTLDGFDVYDKWFVDFEHDYHTFSGTMEKADKDGDINHLAALLVGMELAGSSAHYSGCFSVDDLPSAEALNTELEALQKANPALPHFATGFYVHYARNA